MSPSPPETEYFLPAGKPRASDSSTSPTQSCSSDPSLLTDPREEQLVTCPVQPNGSAHQEPNLNTDNGHLRTAGNQGQRSWQQWIRKYKYWLIISVIVVVGIIIGLSFLIHYVTQAEALDNNPDNEERNSTEPPDAGGALIWQNCSGIRLNISTDEVSWGDANGNCTKYGGQLIDKSQINKECIKLDEDFWIKRENPQSDECESYNMNHPNLTLKCDTQRRYICSKS